LSVTVYLFPSPFCSPHLPRFTIVPIRSGLSTFHPLPAPIFVVAQHRPSIFPLFHLKSFRRHSAAHTRSNPLSLCPPPPPPRATTTRPAYPPVRHVTSSISAISREQAIHASPSPSSLPKPAEQPPPPPPAPPPPHSLRRCASQKYVFPVPTFSHAALLSAVPPP